MTRLGVTQLRDRLAEALGQVRYARERVVIHSRGKDIACVVPIEDLELLESLEDQGLYVLAEEAKERSTGSVTLDEARAKLGL